MRNDPKLSIGPREEDDRLLPRERETLIIMCSARFDNPSQIAKHMGITISTLNCYRDRIYRKLGVHNQFQLIRRAVLRGLFNINEWKDWEQTA